MFIDNSSPAMETHYTVQDVAKLWKMSADLAREIFRDVPGVLRVTRPETRKKRRYDTLRIPQSVLDRVHLERTKVN